MRFFALKKGCDNLNNKEFTQKTYEEKRQHLCGALWHITNGCLDSNSIESIVAKVALNRQYAVHAFSDSHAFRAIISQMRICKSPLSVVVSKNTHGLLIAAITPLKEAAQKRCRRAIYIYAPKLHYRKGAKRGEE